MVRYQLNEVKRPNPKLEIIAQNSHYWLRLLNALTSITCFAKGEEKTRIARLDGGANAKNR